MRRTGSLQHDTSLRGRLWLPAGQKGGKQPINQKNTITTVTITIMLQRSGSDFTHHHQHYQLLGGPQGVKGQSGRSCGAVSLTVTAEICIQQCPDLPGFLICKCQAKRRYRVAVESRHSHSASGGLGITGCSQSGWEKKERKEKKKKEKVAMLLLLLLRCHYLGQQRPLSEHCCQASSPIWRMNIAITITD